jgi:hypothetical protein
MGCKCGPTRRVPVIIVWVAAVAVLMPINKVPYMKFIRNSSAKMLTDPHHCHSLQGPASVPILGGAHRQFDLLACRLYGDAIVTHGPTIVQLAQHVGPAGGSCGG